MNTPVAPETPAEWRTVRLREYSEPLDLFGKDLISILSRSKEEVSNMVGKMAAQSEMQTEELPGEYVTSLTGEVADEVHEWPNATLGPGFRHLMLQFREGRLVHMRWKFQGVPRVRESLGGSSGDMAATWSNHSAAGKPGIAPRLANGHHWPGLPEPSR